MKWAPDSWVKVILVGSLAFGFVVLVTITAVRAVIPSYNVPSENIVAVFDRFGALFGVALGYALGSKRD